MRDRITMRDRVTMRDWVTMRDLKQCIAICK